MTLTDTDTAPKTDIEAEIHVVDMGFCADIRTEAAPMIAYWGRMDGDSVKETGGGRYKLTDSDIERGFQLADDDDVPINTTIREQLRSARWCRDVYRAQLDGSDAVDVLVQLACFGRVVYG